MIPLRRYLIRILLTTQLPLVLLLVGVAWWGARTLMLGLARKDGEARLGIAVHALDQRLRNVERGGLLIRDWWAQGRVPFGDPDATASLLMPWIHDSPDFQLVNLLDERGHSLLLVHDDSGVWKARVAEPGPKGGCRIGWREVGPQGLVDAPRAFNEVAYDPRSRPWYQEARTLASGRWSRPYLLDPPAAPLVVTWLVPLKAPGGATMGAVGVDLLPREMKTFLESLRPTPGSRLWLLDEQGVVLVSAQGAMAEVPAPGVGRQVALAGGAHQLMRGSLMERPGSRWQLLLAMPEAELLAPVRGRMVGITLLAAAMMIPPILLAFRMARRVAKNIQKLARAADHLGDGSVLELPTAATLEFDRLGKAIAQAHAQVRERAQLEQRLQQNLRLETLGTLSAGLAHEVNNQLGAILGHLHLARQGLPPTEPSVAHLARAEAAAQSCARTTDSMLAFTREGQGGIGPIDFNDLVQRTIALLERVLGSHVEVAVDLDAAGAVIVGDPVKLEQVLTELCVNARDAMAGGGTLTVRTRVVSEEQVALEIADSGIGMTPASLARIFEPFYTTKPIGKGTGLGLSMVYGIVRGHRGQIHVESAPGAGTRVHLSFPRVAGALSVPAPGPAAAPPPGAAPLQGLRLLVAEDEDYLLDVLTQAMGEAGAVVTAAASGEEAWKAFGEDRFDCVWSDQRMPGCTGTELLRRIRATGSRVPFILASGQDLKPLRQSLGEDPHLRFMPKPFAIGDLIGEIQGLIAPPPNG